LLLLLQVASKCSTTAAMPLAPFSDIVLLLPRTCLILLSSCLCLLCSWD
jgi:hypothetical protein